MNIPNKITLVRIILVLPIFILLLIPLANPISKTFLQYNMLNWRIWCFVLAGIIFTIAILTDFLDGHIARKTCAVTNLGKFLDPLADKLLTNLVIIFFAFYGVIPVWVAIFIILRDLYVSTLRSVASAKKIIISASQVARAKTLVMSLGLIILFFTFPAFKHYSQPVTSYGHMWHLWIINLPVFVAVLLSAFTAYNYTVKNMSVLVTKNEKK